MTSENVTEAEAEAEAGEAADPQRSNAVDDWLIDELVFRAQAEGLQLTGEGGLLQLLTKRLLESALEGETVLTDVGPVEISVPRHRLWPSPPKAGGTSSGCGPATAARAQAQPHGCRSRPSPSAQGPPSRRT